MCNEPALAVAVDRRVKTRQIGLAMLDQVVDEALLLRVEALLGGHETLKSAPSPQHFHEDLLVDLDGVQRRPASQVTVKE